MEDINTIILGNWEMYQFLLLYLPMESSQIQSNEIFCLINNCDTNIFKALSQILFNIISNIYLWYESSVLITFSYPLNIIGNLTNYYNSNDSNDWNPTYKHFRDGCKTVRPNWYHIILNNYYVSSVQFFLNCFYWVILLFT